MTLGTVSYTHLITPRGQYICFDKDEITLSGKKLWAGKQEFACKAFEQLRESSIKGLYIYACSAGDYTLPDEDVLSQVYACLLYTSSHGDGNVVV